MAVEKITIERDIRDHIITIDGDRVLGWEARPKVGARNGEIIPMSYQQKKPYKHYIDKKGEFIKLSCDEKTHKHYL